MTRIYVPCDSSALALGAEAVAAAIASEAAQRGVEVQIVRNGSRGLLWLEPLVEVETAQGRIGYSNVEVEDLGALFDAGFIEGGAHEKNVGVVDELPYLKKQQRLTFARIGITDPLSIDDYVANGGIEGLRRALDMNGDAACEALIESGLRGRGGAAFPAGIKWRTVRGALADAEVHRLQRRRRRFRHLLRPPGDGRRPLRADRRHDHRGHRDRRDEGLHLRALRIPARDRDAQPRDRQGARRRLARRRACSARRHAFELEVAKGAGAYVCGEETALLESLEGKRGIVRAKPPVPALVGLFGKPTVINNVITLATVPIILAKGASFYRDFGMGRSRGTLPFQLAGNVKHGGLVETRVRRDAARADLRLRRRHGERPADARGAGRRPARHLSAGEPVGHPARLRSVCGGRRGGRPRRHSSCTTTPSNLADLAHYAMHFCAIESCGKCTPCRIGSTRGVEVIAKIRAGDTSPKQVTLLRDLCDTMVSGSLCAMGGMTPFPVLSALDHFPEDFGLAKAPSQKAA